MKREYRLTRSTDFRRVRREGKSYAHPLIVLSVMPNEDPTQLRVGITTSRAVGGSVDRNRVKRRIRSCIEPMLDAIPEGHDLVIIARQPACTAEYEHIYTAINELLHRAGLLAMHERE